MAFYLNIVTFCILFVKESVKIDVYSTAAQFTLNCQTLSLVVGDVVRKMVTSITIDVRNDYSLPCHNIT